jgi:hypothetical protein
MTALFLAALACVAFLALVVVSFVIEVAVLLFGAKDATRPSTVIDFLGVWARRTLRALGEFWAILPDVLHWGRRLLNLLADWLAFLIPKAVLDKARADLDKAFRQWVDVPLAWVDGLIKGLSEATWLGWALFVPATLVGIVVWQLVCLLLGLPEAFLQPFWYLGLVASALNLVPTLLAQIWDILWDIPAALRAIFVAIKHMLPIEVRVAFLDGLAVLAKQFKAVPPAMWLLLVLALVIAAAPRLWNLFGEAPSAPTAAANAPQPGTDAAQRRSARLQEAVA